MDGYIIKLNKDIELDITEMVRSPTTKYFIILYDKNKRSEIVLSRDEFKTMIDFMLNVYNGDES